jgi:hypothetical protein
MGIWKATVGPPERFGGGCWGKKRVGRHNALGFAMFGPLFQSCSKQAREGRLTCWAHRHLEDKAQKLAERLRKREDDTKPS